MATLQTTEEIKPIGGALANATDMTSATDTVNAMKSENDKRLGSGAAPVSSFAPSNNPSLTSGVSREINPATETARGQLSSMLAEDSPYLDVARTGAKQTAARRGLQNTSIAAGAGEKAAIEAAAPIAAQTAGVYERKALGEQQYQQQGGILAQQADIQKEASERAYAQQRGLNEQQFANTKAFEEIRVANQETLMNLDAGNREKFANLEREHQATMQNNASAVNLYGNTTQAISNILSNPDLSPEQQQAGVNKQIEFLNNGLKLVGSISGEDIVFPGVTPTSGTSETPSYLNSDVQNSGGLAPGQSALSVAGTQPDLSPGTFLGETKLIKENTTTGGPKPQFSTKDTLLQWTPEGWKRL